MQISRNIVNWLKSNYYVFWWNSGYRLRPETISPLFAELPSTIHV